MLKEDNHNMISIDGVSLSILLIWDELIDKFSKPKNTSISKEQYIDELDDYPLNDMLLNF